MQFITTGLIIWCIAFLSWDLCKYNYQKRLKPLMIPLLYYMQAHWELYQHRLQAKVKEIKKREFVPLVDIEEVQEEEPRKREGPNTTIWIVENYKELGEAKHRTQQIEENTEAKV